MSETPDNSAEGAEAPLDFDPYRFGKPDYPIPPEYAPPGYVPPPDVVPPPPDPRTAYPAQGNPAQGYPQQPYPQQPYPQQPYPQQPYPQQGQYGNYPPMPPQFSAQYPAPRTGNGKATAGLVLGIASILLCWTTIIDIIIVGLGLTFSILGRNAANRNPGLGGRGAATAGLICSVVGALLLVVLLIVFVKAINACGGFGQNTNSSEFRDCVQHYLHLK